MAKFTGKVAVVTGASKGIGAAIARHLPAEGASVVANYSSDRKGAEALVGEITKAGGQAIAVQASVAIEGEVEALFELRAGRSVTSDEFSRMFNTNVLGLCWSSYRAAPVSSV